MAEREVPWELRGEDRAPADEDAPAFGFLHRNRRAAKPRARGLTEVRGPYYTAMGPRYLADLLETMGPAIDGLKFAGGSFALLPRRALRELLDLCHAHGVKVSTGGFVERVLLEGEEAVEAYLRECAGLGFDLVEVSSGFLAMPEEDLVRLTERVLEHGLEPRPEVGVQFGAGAGVRPEELEAEGQRDVGQAVRLARKHLAAGAPLVMVESEGLTEGVGAWRTGPVERLAQELGPERLVFEAADPPVFQWYVRTFGPEVNLFVDHSQVVQLEALRQGLWGPPGLWARVATYKP